MKLFLTDDGSHSVVSEQFGVAYHSKHGAIQETQHVFINSGLKHITARSQNEIAVLEIGFGTGLNAFMTFLEAIKSDLKIEYTTIEAYPLSKKEVLQLNYVEKLGASEYKTIFESLHSCSWIEKSPLSKNFIFQKKMMDFEAINFTETFDLIYFDAFAPESQPQLWEASMMHKMYAALKPNGVMTTYCAKGNVKRTLKSVGFEIEKLAGPPGKREMTRAYKK